jgi:hypothetical protein
MAADCEQFVRRTAGVVILTGFVLGWFVNQWFFIITAFAGANLIQSTFTGICPPRRVCQWRGSSSEG